MTDLDLLQKILAALPLLVVVTDSNGTIIYANARWDATAHEAGVQDLGAVSVGANYFAVAARSAENNAPSAAEALLGLQSVSNGTADYFEMEYACPAAQGEFWFVMRVTPLSSEPPRGLVIMHADITHSRNDLMDELSSQKVVEQQGRQEREMVSLEAISSQTTTSIAAAIYGKLPLRETNPAIFGTLVSRYGQALLQSLEQRTYRVQDTLDDDLREIAQRLRFQNAGPRDVLDIHLAAIKAELRRANGSSAPFLLEESRSLVLRLMGNLLSLYRLEAIATRQSFAAREAE